MSEAVEVLRQLLAAIDARESSPGLSEHWCCCGAPSLTEAKAKARMFLERAATLPRLLVEHDEDIRAIHNDLLEVTATIADELYKGRTVRLVCPYSETVFELNQPPVTIRRETPWTNEITYNSATRSPDHATGPGVIDLTGAAEVAILDDDGEFE